MRDFLKTILATLVGLFLFSIMGLGGLLFLVAAISSASKDVGPSVEDRTILSFNLSQGISDSRPESDPSTVLGEALSGRERNDAIALRDAVNAIRAAAKDKRIVGIYLSGNVNPEVGTGYATLREVRDALKEFRDSGKPIIAYDDDWVERDYYLTSVANQILMNPMGTLEVNGLRSEMMFFAGALEKFGIGVQVVRAGRYKSGVEPFTRSSSSPEDRLQTQQLLTELWKEFLTTAATARKLTPQKLQAIADTQGMLMPDEAQKAGLVDRVAYADEVVAELHKLTGEDSKAETTYRRINLADYADLVAADERQSGGRIALVYAEGSIVSGGGSPGQIGGDRLARLLRDLRLDEDVKAIVIRVNSPGGSATASDRVAREVLLARKVKPVIVSMGSIAASGGYQIAAHASEIFASPNTITGSIGVFGVLPNFQKIANSNGITWDVIKTGRLADMETVIRPRTPEELAKQQRVVDRIYANFLDTVTENRPISQQKILEIAQGRVWSGVAAKNLGLVDQLGGLNDAIQAAAKAAKLGDSWQIEEYPKPRSVEERLISTLLSSLPFGAVTATDPIESNLKRLTEDLEILRTLDDPMHAYTRLPFNLRID